MIDKRFLNFKTKSAFESLLNDGQINENSIAFIEGDEQNGEPNLIWTHGQYYMGGSGIDPQIEEDVDQLKDDVSQLQSDFDDYQQEFSSAVSTLNGRCDTLDTSVGNLNTAITNLETQVYDDFSKICIRLKSNGYVITESSSSTSSLQNPDMSGLLFYFQQTYPQPNPSINIKDQNDFESSIIDWQYEQQNGLIFNCFDTTTKTIDKYRIYEVPTASKEDSSSPLYQRNLTWEKVKSNDTGYLRYIQLTQTEYDALSTKEADVIYLITA